MQSVYSHFAGNVPVNGIIIYEHYKDISKVRQLISLGSVNSLKEELVPPEGVLHTLDKAHPGVTTFFGRDGNSSHCVINSFSSLEDFVKNGDVERYNYVFKEKTNQWYVMNPKSSNLRRLDAALLNDSQVNDAFKTMLKSVKLSKRLNKNLAAKNTVERKSKI